MKYLNGQLRNERDATLLFKPKNLKQDLNWKEYFPMVVLGVLLGLLLSSLF